MKTTSEQRAEWRAIDPDDEDDVPLDMLHAILDDFAELESQLAAVTKERDELREQSEDRLQALARMMVAFGSIRLAFRDYTDEHARHVAIVEALDAFDRSQLDARERIEER